MNRLSTEQRARIVGALVEGNSIRATCRMTGAAKNTVVKLLADLGAACSRYQDEHLRNLYSRRIECDEIWSFCYAKAKNVPDEHRGEFGYGDVWTWTAIDADSKLIPCWLVGERTQADAISFMSDLADRMSQRIQITTDGLKAYRDAVEVAFGTNVDFAQLIKDYGRDPSEPESRYSPAKCMSSETRIMQGDPDKRHISTSYVERQNLTMRMGIRRFTRLTNGFSKKVENLAAAVSLHFMHYNFARVHKTLGMTPAMAAGVADHVWSMAEIAGLLD
jgi:IS1 family transposase